MPAYRLAPGPTGQFIDNPARNTSYPSGIGKVMPEAVKGRPRIRQADATTESRKPFLKVV
jgi:hypothetical protein